MSPGFVALGQAGGALTRRRSRPPSKQAAHADVLGFQVFLDTHRRAFASQAGLLDPAEGYAFGGEADHRGQRGKGLLAHSICAVPSASTVSA